MEPIARFKFKNYRIAKSLITIGDEQGISKDLSVEFSLTGEDKRKEHCFELTIHTSIADKSNNLKIEVDIIGFFEFDQDCEQQELNGYFFTNAPAILFPYLRAYISSLTCLSGLHHPVILPTLNISKKGEELEQNTHREN